MTADELRVLDMLAGSADGSTDALLAAHGFELDVLIRIVSADFATATPERTCAAGRPVETTRVKITVLTPTPNCAAAWRRDTPPFSTAATTRSRRSRE
jgi:hypothetical protein